MKETLESIKVEEQNKKTAVESAPSLKVSSIRPRISWGEAAVTAGIKDEKVTWNELFLPNSESSTQVGPGDEPS